MFEVHVRSVSIATARKAPSLSYVLTCCRITNIYIYIIIYIYINIYIYGMIDNDHMEPSLHVRMRCW